MDGNSQYFIELLNAFIKDTLPPKPVDIDWDRIYNLSSFHSLSGAVYLPVQKLDNSDKPEQSILNKFKSDFFYATIRYEEQEKTYHEIIQKLNEHKIEHLFFKGIIIREYYPVKQVRTLGDIDFLLHEKDQNEVKEIFMGMGYKNNSSLAHEKYQKGKLVIEAHDKIINNKFSSKADYLDCFKNSWAHATAKENGYTYVLNMEYHLVYLIAHIAKHFYQNGAGVRMVLDIAVILKRFGNTLKFSFIWEELKKINLDNFAKCIFGLCDRWFQVGTYDTKYKMDETTYELMSKYVLKGGTFGFGLNAAIREMRKQYSRTDNRKLIQFKAFWGKVFLNYEEMKTKYPVLVKAPYILPFAWIHRWFKAVTKKRIRTANTFRGFFECTEEAEQTYNLMKTLGL